MHNSLFTREELKRANADSVYTRFRDPYRGLTIDNPGTAKTGEFVLAGTWRIEIDAAIDAGARSALQSDLQQLWARLGLAVNAQSSTNELRVSLRSHLGQRDCELELAPGKIALAGGGTAGLWGAVAWLVWEFRTRRAAVLPLANRKYCAAWKVQISQGPWGGNYSVPDFGPEYLSDESFRLYAHNAVNSMMIYGDLLCYVKSSILPELNHPEADRHLDILREAGERAARYGVGFTYVPVHPKLSPAHPVFRTHPDVRGRAFQADEEFCILCSSSAKSLAFYREQYQRLFQAVPALQGLLAISYSESFYHCDMWPQRESHPCAQCENLTRDQRVIPLLDTVADAIQTVRTSTFFAEWIYTWGPTYNGGRSLEQIHATRPPHVGVCQSVDKDPLYDGKTVYAKAGYRKSIWDYCAEYEGPTDYAREAAAFAKRDGRIFIAKTETASGIETMQFPYVPALQHFTRKWQGVRSLRPDGVHQAWLFYGHHGSRGEQLAAWAAYREDLCAGDYLEQLAVADFGPQAAADVLTFWARAGRAIKHLPCLHLGDYYRSPSYLGPCHPLLPDVAAPVPEVFHAHLYYLQEDGPSFSTCDLAKCKAEVLLKDLPETPDEVGVYADHGLGWDLVADEYAIAAEEARKGWTALGAAKCKLQSDADRLHWQEEEALGELLWRTFLSCEYVVRFMMARRARGGACAEATLEMRRVAALERENAHAALSIYQRAPWLDPRARLDGIFPAAASMIGAKLRIIDSFLKQN
jgi:hypothetical protein